MEGSKKTILIVDDELDFLDVLVGRLEDAGYTAITATDGFSGLEKARNELPDLIVMDLLLPKLNGFKFTRLLKFDESYKHIPIIIISARVEEADKQLAMEVGADMYFTKPFDQNQLLKSIAKLTASAS